MSINVSDMPEVLQIALGFKEGSLSEEQSEQLKVSSRQTDRDPGYYRDGPFDCPPDDKANGPS